MKIIQPGVIPIVDKSIPWWRWVVFTCDNCSCKFQLEPHDPDPSFGKHGVVERCPTCKDYVCHLSPSRLKVWWLERRNKI